MAKSDVNSDDQHRNSRYDRILAAPATRATRQLVILALPQILLAVSNDTSSDMTMPRLAPQTNHICFGLWGNDWRIDPWPNGQTCNCVKSMRIPPWDGSPMAQVPHHIYDDLVRDTLQVVCNVRSRFGFICLLLTRPSI